MPDIFTKASQNFKGAVTLVTKEFATLRTGRANPAILDRIQIEDQGTLLPLRHIASISVPAPTLLAVQPYNPSHLKLIEKAILNSDLNLNPSNDGKLIRLALPSMTEERRKELVRQAGQIAERGRIAARSSRNDLLREIKRQKSIGLSEDEIRHQEKKLQKKFEEHMQEIDTLLKQKSQEIFTV